ncbi:MAG: DUF6805 domain-containing protein [Vicinamibacterales bacterium]
MSAAIAILLVCLSATAEIHQVRRIVDVVKVGDTASERDHDYAGEEVTTGVSGGKAFRQTRNWMRYALKVYEDTEVTVACTFVGSDGARVPFELVVEDRLIATHVFTSPSTGPAIAELRVPFALTKGKTNIMVMLRAAKGANGPPPALIELRTIQDHLEHGPVPIPVLASARSGGSKQ